MPDRTVKSRAIVCFVDDNEHLIQQALALRESWLYVQSTDTDMVVFGPSSVLAQFPDDVVKIEQRAVADDPEWFSYRYGNSPACLNGPGAYQLDRYAHLLLTDVDTFITPAWNGFYPSGFVCGNGGYSNDDDVRRKIQETAQELGLSHRGLTNTGSTWYGPTKLVRRVSALTEMLTRYILSRHFRTDEGAWPGWYRGVALLYASEIAINHCVPHATKTDQLDYFSTSRASVQDHAHIHCWHADEKFSKHWFMMRRYSADDAKNLNLDVIADYAMEMSFRSLKVTPAKDVLPAAALSPTARKLPLAEMREKSVRLGYSHVAVIYPEELDAWFDGLVEPRNESGEPAKWVRLSPGRESSRYDILTSVDSAVEGLNLGDALATFWERVSFLLVDDLRDAMVLHAATLRQGNRIILLPGPSGAGKTHLSLWYRTQGYDWDSDEIISVSFGSDDVSEPFLGCALARPAVLKAGSEDVAGGMAGVRQGSSTGTILKLDAAMPLGQSAIEGGLIIVPRFVSGTPLNLRALTPGEASLHLLGNCLNFRNLPRGGLPLASQLARRLPAIAINYGETSQLEGTLDVITRQLLQAPASPQDLVELCDAFTIKASVRTDAAVPIVVKAEPAIDTAKRTAPAPTVARFPRRLTIGMATYDDYDGVYFTVQSIQMNNPELNGAVEFVVIDNNPGGACSESLSNLAGWVDGYRYVPRGEWCGTAIRNAIFEEASSPIVLCIDSHVLIVPGALSKLIAYFEAHADSRDLLQGPMIYDNMRNIATHMEPRWRDGMYGIWSDDPRGADSSAPIFEIPMHGLGLFACRAAAWAGFNPKFRGFGGEEGYIHEKMRQRGGRTLCLPSLRWLHRFGRPLGLPYPNRWADRMRNYFIGFRELGLDTAEMEAHFAEHLGTDAAARIFSEIRLELEGTTT